MRESEAGARGRSAYIAMSMLTSSTTVSNAKTKERTHEANGLSVDERAHSKKSLPVKEASSSRQKMEKKSIPPISSVHPAASRTAAGA